MKVSCTSKAAKQKHQANFTNKSPTNFTIWARGARCLLRTLKANVKPLLLNIGAAQIIRNIQQVIVRLIVYIIVQRAHMIFKF